MHGRHTAGDNVRREEGNNPDLQLTATVTFHWPTNINVVPIDYAFLPPLRGRLTLRGLALRRNPWNFGVSVSHTHFATHVRILTSDTSRKTRVFPSQAYRTLRYHLTLTDQILSFGR